jgi:hypothetical protein
LYSMLYLSEWPMMWLLTSRKIKFHQCRVWSIAGICIGTKSFLLLYQWHVRWYKINSETLCRRHDSLPQCPQVTTHSKKSFICFLTDVCYMAFPLQVWCNCYAKIFCRWYRELMTCWKIWSGKHWKREGQMQD